MPMHPHKHSRSHRLRLAQDLLPWCLDFGEDQKYDVNIGHAASIDDLHSADFTADLYWYLPPHTAPDYFHTLFGQGYHSIGHGWRFTFRTETDRLYFRLVDGDGVDKQVSISSVTSGAWYYLRGRRSGNNMYLSLNASAESSAAVAAGGTASDVDLTIGNQSATYPALGKVCYAHLWNTNKGALATVPTSPFAIDANTVARYLFTDGGGSTLADSSGEGNDGTITGAAWTRQGPPTWSPS